MRSGETVFWVGIGAKREIWIVRNLVFLVEHGVVEAIWRVDAGVAQRTGKSCVWQPFALAAAGAGVEIEGRPGEDIALFATQIPTFEIAVADEVGLDRFAAAGKGRDAQESAGRGGQI